MKPFACPQVISSPQTLEQMEATEHHLTTNFKNHKNRLNRRGRRAHISMAIDYYSLDTNGVKLITTKCLSLSGNDK